MSHFTILAQDPRLYWVWILLLAGCSCRGGEILKNGDFKDGNAGWSDLATDADREAGVVDFEGGKALKLARIKTGAKAAVTQYNLAFKPQTLYRLAVTGKGAARAVVALRPSSSKNKEFFELCKSWATSSAPLEASEQPVTESLLFDSGLQADSAFLSLRLDGEQPGTYYVTKVSLMEAGSSKPDKEELVLAHLGDSLTSTSYLPFSQRVDAVLGGLIAQSFPALKIRQLNLGADGEYVKELFDTRRYESALKGAYAKIDLAIIRYGSNDSRQGSADEFKKQLSLLCDALQRDYPGIAIILGTGAYLHGNDEVNKQYGAYWQAARDLAKERNYPVADIFNRFQTEASPKTARAPGDMHPSPYGVKLAAEAEFAVLAKILEAKKNK